MTIQDLIYQWERDAGFTRPSLPELPEPSVAQHRLDFLTEELNELAYAFDDEDLVEVADALGDLLWVTYGTAHACGINLDAVVEEIGRSNYTKLIEGVSEGNDRKIGKGPSYEPPDLESVLTDQEPLD